MRLCAMRSHDQDVLLLSLTRDGRLVDPRAFDAIQDRLPDATDCFLFCHGWLVDQAEAREGAARFFTHLDGALRPLGDRVRPFLVAVHWPSKPFADPDPESRRVRDEVWPELLGGLGYLARSRPGLLTQLVGPFCEAEVPLGPEDEIELDALLRQVRDGALRGGLSLTPLHALSFWLMKRRAGQVGERLGRELLAPAFTVLGDKAPRLHLIGHSFGAKLLTSSVLGGLRPESLVLLLAAFSAFAFAEEVPTKKRPGFYRPVVAERLVAGPIVALRSDHDRALGRLYPAFTWGGQVDRVAPDLRRLDRVREVVARSAMGAVGVRGVGAPELDLITTQTTGLPRSLVNVDGSRVVTKPEWLIGAHCDIYHDEIATLVLLAAGLLTGGPEGARPRPVSPFSIS
jgi:hypothetical protein